MFLEMIAFLPALYYHCFTVINFMMRGKHSPWFYRNIPFDVTFFTTFYDFNVIMEPFIVIMTTENILKIFLIKYGNVSTFFLIFFHSKFTVECHKINRKHLRLYNIFRWLIKRVHLRHLSCDSFVQMVRCSCLHWSTRRSLDHSQIMLESMHIRFYTNLKN